MSLTLSGGQVVALPEAREPAEVRGAGRDDVRLLVAHRDSARLEHARFDELPDLLDPGDLLVVNTSATLPAALPARLGRRALELHLSTPVGDGSWTVELRTADLLPLRRPPLGSRIDLPEGAHAELVAAYLGSHRLSVARLTLGVSVERYLAHHGRPIRYRYLDGEWPIGAYQTVFALEPGSAEMPSAARPFTAEIVTELVARGVLVAPVTLHTGVSSLERGEHPYPERYRVPAATARLVNATREWGGRVIAVGTTVVRALETVAAPDGTIATAEGWTNHVVTPRDGLRAIDGLLTGWHDPESSHLELLKAAMGPELVERSYRAALAQGYLFHEFGDTHLILP
jgi:S-adenosylmethionine:tRNA ribosyltransferase-isomerase